MHLAIVLVVAIILCFTYSKLFPKKHASVAKLPSPPKHPIFGHLPFLLDSDNLVHYLEHWASELGELYQFDLPFTTAVVVSSPVEIIKILKSRPSHFQKPESFQRVFHEIGLKGLLTVDGDEWRHSRRLISPAFTASKLKFMNDNVIKHALEFRRDLLKVSERQKELVRKPFKPSELDDCSSLFGKMTFSVVLQIAFGTVGNLMSPDYSRKSKIAFQCLNERLDRVLPLHKIYRTERDVILDEVFDEMDAFTDELIVEYRRGNERFAGTVFETLMIAHEEDKNDDFKLFKGNLKTVLLAGFETTSNSIQSMLRLLIDNPLVFRKAQIEVDQVLGSNPTEQDYYSHPVEDFPYCQNVVKEVVRIYSVLNYAYYESMQPVEVGGIHLLYRRRDFSQGNGILCNAAFRTLS